MPIRKIPERIIEVPYSDKLITQVDQWRLITNITLDKQIDGSDLKRVDDTTFSIIGGGMLVDSAGTFTFPQTGLYKITAEAAFYRTVSGDDNQTVNIKVSNDAGSTWTSVGILQDSSTGVNLASSGTMSVIFDVQNLSNDKISFWSESIGSGSYISSTTDRNYTAFTFIRLGSG